MFHFWKPILLLLCVPTFAFGCSPKCQDEGAFECLKDANQCVEHRVCVHGKWVTSECEVTEVCIKEGCVALTEVCQDTQNRCISAGRLEICVAGERPSEQVCGEEAKCVAGVCADTCSNNRLDEGEAAVDCGGACPDCVGCRSNADCGDSGFCDSAFGYVCSKRCRTDADCVDNGPWDGAYCRGDGRCSSKVFETVWDVTAEDPTVVLPFDPDYPKAKCDFRILWGDEAEGTDITRRPRVTECTAIENRTHAYSKAGRYSVKIIGTYDGWGDFDLINNDAEHDLTPAAPKLRSVRSFGPVGLSRTAFYGASMLETMPMTDIPDASKLKSLSKTFEKAYAFNAPIGHWDTSKVTDMEHVFYKASAFNQPLGAWNTAEVIDMSGMFSRALVFNQPIGAWNTSKLKLMRHMFHSAEAFDQPLDAWDSSKVQDMRGMFESATAFNQAVGAWDTSNVKDMSAMFLNASLFNQPIGSWNTSKVQNMTQMFDAAVAFDQPIGTWNVSEVLNMVAMFANTMVFNQPLDAWDVSKAQDMGAMFYNAQAFNQPLGAWNVTKVFDVSDMFKQASKFNQPLGAWDVSHVQNMSRMFDLSLAFDQELSQWALNSGVVLEAIFTSSGMSKRNLCALKSKGGAWRSQWSKLGKSAVCK